MRLPVSLRFASCGVVLLAACTFEEAGTGPCAGVTWPTTSGSVLRVSASCGGPQGDGSTSRPYPSISAALAKAKTGDTVVVAAGTYQESLSVTAGISVVGSGSGSVRLQPQGKAGILVTGTGATRLEGLTVAGASGFGIGVQTAAVTMQGVRVEKTQASASKPGHGIEAQGAASLALQGCQVVGSAGVGVVAAGSGPVSIIDPLFFKDPQANAKDVVGIIDPLFTPQSRIDGNQGGGIAIIDPLFVKADAVVPPLTLARTDVVGNGKYGVALFGAGATVQHSAIRATKAAAGPSSASGPAAKAAADGLVVAPATQGAGQRVDVQIDEATVVTGHARAGVLVTAEADVQIAGEVSLCGRGGVWAQHAKAVLKVVAGAHLAQNAMVGVAVTAGATLQMDGARVTDTKPLALVPSGGGASVELADGVGVFGQARGTIKGAILVGNPRAGIIGRDCAANSSGMPDLLVEGTSITGSKYGVVINGSYGANAAASAAPESGGNDYQDVASKTASDDLPVQDTPCEGNGTDCAPQP